MIALTTLSDRDLIDFVYSEIAGQKIRDKITDFSDSKYWQQIVSKMNKPVSLVYRMGIFNRQVMNGGLIQYFDNGYAIFAFETINDCRIINAKLTQAILERCLKIINPNNYLGDRFVRYVSDREYDNDYENIENKLNTLDKEYYDLGKAENLEALVGAYLRQNLNEVK